MRRWRLKGEIYDIHLFIYMSSSISDPPKKVHIVYAIKFKKKEIQTHTGHETQIKL